MVLESILSGLHLISSVTGLLRSAQVTRRDAVLASTLNRAEYLLSSVRAQTRDLSSSTDVPLPVVRSYAHLVQLLQDSSSYQEHLEIIPTGQRTWRVCYRRCRRNAILRDPRGEFSYEPSGQQIRFCNGRGSCSESRALKPWSF